MYLLCMIKARIRWCTCRVENILTLGKSLSLWFCFLLHSILFLISQISYRTYKIISSYELARPIMGTIFLVIAVDGDVLPSGRLESILSMATNSEHLKGFFLQLENSRLLIQFTQPICKCVINNRDWLKLSEVQHY